MLWWPIGIPSGEPAPRWIRGTGAGHPTRRAQVACASRHYHYASAPCATARLSTANCGCWPPLPATGTGVHNSPRYGTEEVVAYPAPYRLVTLAVPAAATAINGPDPG